MDKRTMANYTFSILRTKSKKIRGTIGECFIAQALTDAGYFVTGQAEKCMGDLNVIDQTSGEYIKIEVKTATKNADGYYKFLLQKRDKYGGTDCRHSDVLILVTVSKSGSAALFVLPASDMQQKSISICGNPHQYRGKWSKYRQYYSGINLRTVVHNFNDRVATNRHPVYSGVTAGKQ